VAVAVAGVLVLILRTRAALAVEQKGLLQVLPELPAKETRAEITVVPVVVAVVVLGLPENRGTTLQQVTAAMALLIP
jgi:hypothetical protein